MSLLKMRNNDSPTHTYLDINVYNAPLNNNKKVPLIYYEQTASAEHSVFKTTNDSI